MDWNYFAVSYRHHVIIYNLYIDNLSRSLIDRGVMMFSVTEIQFNINNVVVNGYNKLYRILLELKFCIPTDMAFNSTFLWDLPVEINYNSLLH